MNPLRSLPPELDSFCSFRRGDGRLHAGLSPAAPALYSGRMVRTQQRLYAGPLTLTEVAAGFAVSALIGKFPDRRVPLITVLLLLLAGLLCLVFSPGTTPVLSTLLLGIGIGALFPLSLIVTFDHARTPAQAGKLLSKVQGGGYMIAALMPLVAGIVRDSSVSLTSAWLVMSAGVVLLIAIAFTFKPTANVQAR